MFFGGKEKDVAVYGAIIDVSSGSIGCAIVESHETAPFPKIIYAHRTPFGASKMRENLLATLTAVINEGVAALRAYAPKAAITKVFITCSSPHGFTAASSVRYESQEPFKVTRKMVEDLIVNAERETLKSAEEQSVGAQTGFEIVERATVDISVNEYLVTRPYNLKGNSLALSHVAGLIPKGVLSMLGELRDRLFPHVELKTHTLMLVMYCVLRDVLPKMHEACIINVTEYVTEFGIIEHDLLMSNASINAGTAGVAEKMGRPEADIRSTLMEQNATTPFPVEVYEAFVSAYSVQLLEHLNNQLTQRILPATVILSAPAPYAQLFKEMISKVLKDLSPYTHTILLVEPPLLIDPTTTVSAGMDDVYLAASIRFFHKLHGCIEIQFED